MDHVSVLTQTLMPIDRELETTTELRGIDKNFQKIHKAEKVTNNTTAELKVSNYIEEKMNARAIRNTHMYTLQVGRPNYR